MTIWFVTRHPGALEWARQQGILCDRQVPHLDPAWVADGDTVIGTLPVNLAAQVCARGACYRNLSLDLPAVARGQELSAEQLKAYGARLEVYHVVLLAEPGNPPDPHQFQGVSWVAPGHEEDRHPAFRPRWLDEATDDDPPQGTISIASGSRFSR